MKKTTIIGAGGKMGVRISRNLKNEPYDISYVEISEEGRERLRKELGVGATSHTDSVTQADIVILAIPDVAIESVSPGIVKLMKPHSLIITLDPAAPYAGKLYHRPDIAYFVAHPSHPSIFNWEPTIEAQKDHFGGNLAKQTMVCALMVGEESDYALGVEIAKKMYAPISVAHRITVEQMAILEPGLVETLSSTCIYVIRQALDEVIKQGMPAEAAKDFLLGHLHIQLAVLFDQIPGAVFSDAANKAIEYGIKEIFQPDWKKVLEIDNVKQQILAIT